MGKKPRLDFAGAWSCGRRTGARWILFAAAHSVFGPAHIRVTGGKRIVCRKELTPAKFSHDGNRVLIQSMRGLLPMVYLVLFLRV